MVVGVTHALIYCTLITTQFERVEKGPCMRTYIHPTKSCNHVLENVLYGTRKAKIRRNSDKNGRYRRHSNPLQGLQETCESRSSFSTRFSLVTCDLYKHVINVFGDHSKFLDPLVRYYLHQGGLGRGDNCVGPIHSNPHFLQRGHEIGIFGRALCVRSCVPCHGMVPMPWVQKHWQRDET